jgi:hypothetical protein
VVAVDKSEIVDGLPVQRNAAGAAPEQEGIRLNIRNDLETGMRRVRNKMLFLV